MATPTKKTRAKAKAKAKRTRAAEIRKRQRELFVAAYVVHRNATRAAEAAGFKAGASARRQGGRMLNEPETIALLDAYDKALLDKLKMTGDEVIVAMSRVARFDPRKLFTAGGQLQPIDELDDETALALAGIEVETRHEKGGEDLPPIVVTLRKIKANDRMKALELLGRVHGLFEKDNRQQQPILYDVNFG